MFYIFFLFLLKNENNYENESKVRFFNKKLKFNTCDATKQLVNIFYFMLCKDQFSSPIHALASHFINLG